jgi:hypothetical protein
MSPLYRWTVRWARTIHLNLTLFGLALLLLFAVTGFMLNHEDWFATTDPVLRTDEGRVPTELLAEPDRLGLVELLRREHGAAGAVDTFEADADTIRVVFKRVGRSTEAEVQREDGSLKVTHTWRGPVGVLLDLHRGKATGFVWSLIIDGVCVLLLVIAATGLVLWWSLKGRGHYGFVTLALGVGLILAVYTWFMP